MIGLFDSGFGGLHVLRGITGRLPAYDYLYLGDSARTPYGPRSAEEVYAYTKQGVEFLFDHGAELVVLPYAASDRTGHAILHTLYQQSLKHQVAFFIEYFGCGFLDDRSVYF